MGLSPLQGVSDPAYLTAPRRDRNGAEACCRGDAAEKDGIKFRSWGNILVEHEPEEGNPVATSPLHEVIKHLRRSALLRDGAGLTDGQLLERFVAHRDEAAFEALLRRHGPMVLGVCRRVLRHETDAEDAFQATFLVLVRKAASVVPRALVGNWLYGVAHHTALKAKAMNSKRRVKERQAGSLPRSEPPAENWQQLQALLDGELSRLPNNYRVPIVLCGLEGKSLKEAARQLGLPQGTVASRLSRGRSLLAKRMAHKGVTLPAGALAVALSQNAALADAPARLVISTMRAVRLFAAGQAVKAGALTAPVAALTEGVIKAMFLTKLLRATVVLAVVAVLGLGASRLTYRAWAEEDPNADRSILLGLFLPAEARKGSLSKEDEALKNTLLALEKQVFEACVKQDLDAYRKCYADEFVGFSMHHRYTMADHLRGLRSVRFGTDYKISDVELIRLSDQAAILSYMGEWKVYDNDGNLLVNRNRRVSEGYVHRGGGWVIAFAQDMEIGKE
ncbi:MAG TPA: sigma-70 family RNA polymerase sigma factor [Gemmataceae bacterium]|nr:sigma-70 family RNA polymerase sigma factor [Gemmataceae bacterium]